MNKRLKYLNVKSFKVFEKNELNAKRINGGGNPQDTLSPFT